MAGTNVGTAYLEVVPSAKGFAGKLQAEVGGGMARSGEQAGKSYGGGFSKGLKRLGGAALGLVAVSQVTGFLKDANAEARESQKVGARTANVIKTTGGVANITADEVGNLAAAISNKTGIDDEAIQTGSNLLLTFKNIRNEVGKGNQIFDRATLAAADLSASGFGDLNGASKQLGKALNDPVKGITALGRAGVTFTDKQKKQIKALVQSNRTLEAQKIILKEVESQVGGSAEAQATAGEKARVSFDNLKETIGTALLPVVDKFSNFVTNDLAPGVTKFVTGMQDGTGAGGDFAEVLQTTLDIGKGIFGLFNSLPGPVKKYGIELALAAVVIGKLNSGLGAFSTRVSTFTTNLATAETRGAKFKATMQGVGAGLRNVAGAGGMLLLADSSKRAGTGLGTLEAAAGGALSGAALGAFAGPPGAAIGAAIGGLAGAAFSLSKNTKDGGKSAKVSLGSWKDYASTLDGVAASTTNATRAMVLERLEKSGLLEATRKLGLSDREAVNAMTGNSAARRKLASLLASSTSLTNKQKDALRQETGAVAKSRLEQLQHNVAIAGSATELAAAKTALKKFMAAPASKRVGITNVEGTIHQINSIRTSLIELFSTKGASALTSGPGGIDVLLQVPKGASGGIVNRPTLALIGEAGPEAVVPLNRTRGNSPLPPAMSAPISLAGQRMRLVVGEQEFNGYVDDRADTRVGAQRALDASIERAFG